MSDHVLEKEMEQNEWQPAPRVIAHGDYLKLVGLLALAEHHRDHMFEIQSACLSITQEKDLEGHPHDMGHTADAIWSGDLDADKLLQRLNTTVSPREAQES